MAKFTGNKDTGSLHLGNELPVAFRKHGLKPEGLFIQISGAEKPRKVTYIMGSESKGYSVCCKGTGEFPTDGEVEVITE